MAMIRFISPPGKPDLELETVPAVFKDYICDIDEADPALSRMRYLGAPFGVVELGVVSADYPWPTLESLSVEIADPASVLGKQLRDLFATAASVALVSDRVTALSAVVDGINANTGGGSSGGTIRVGIGTTGDDYDATNLPDYTLVALKSSNDDAGV